MVFPLSPSAVPGHFPLSEFLETGQYPSFTSLSFGLLPELLFLRPESDPLSLNRAMPANDRTLFIRPKKAPAAAETFFCPDRPMIFSVCSRSFVYYIRFAE